MLNQASQTIEYSIKKPPQHIYEKVGDTVRCELIRMVMWKLITSYKKIEGA